MIVIVVLTLAFACSLEVVLHLVCAGVKEYFKIEGQECPGLLLVLQKLHFAVRIARSCHVFGASSRLKDPNTTVSSDEQI